MYYNANLMVHVPKAVTEKYVLNIKII